MSVSLIFLALKQIFSVKSAVVVVEGNNLIFEYRKQLLNNDYYFT